MSVLPTLAASAELLTAGAALIDLRAPVEVAKGALPHAAVLPLMTDDERAQIGIRFQQAGQGAAIALGETLVAGEIRAARIRQWLAFAKAHPNAVLYCWRGGVRSAIVQQWLADAGCVLPRIAGGYRALRHIAIATLTETATHPRKVLVLGGSTGSGKTVLLRTFASSIDLEALAQHRGSAFGGRAATQPSQTTFENALACAIQTQWHASHGATLYEDEGHLIGRSVVPTALLQRLKTSPLVIVEVPLQHRALHIRSEYVDQPLALLVAAGDPAPHRALAEQLATALAKVQRRLGGLRHDLIRADLDAAFALHERSSDGSGHSRWIEALLTHYYDPMYAYQLGKHEGRIVMRGNTEAVRTYLAHALTGS